MKDEDIVEILIDPRFQINYSSYYIEGIRRVWRNKMRFAALPSLPELSQEDKSHGMAVRVKYACGGSYNIYIDHHDTSVILESMHSWCDRYAKVNLSKDDVSRPKIMAIGPSCAVKLWNLFETVYICLRNYYLSYGYRGFWGAPTRIIPALKQFFHGYIYLLYRRKYYKEYEASYEEDRDYVFTLNTLWYDKTSDCTTTRFRGAFIRSCKACYKKFEGGFYYIDSQEVLDQFPEYTKYLQQYGDVLTKVRVPMCKYLEKIKRSSIVFNTPAVSGCHGWKMAEYMAMGKAMISTTIINEMPEPLIDGHHLLIANSEEEIMDAVERLKKDDDLRKSIKSNAKNYFCKWLSPEMVVRRIFLTLFL